LNCKYGQGYLFARPADTASIDAWISQKPQWQADLYPSTAEYLMPAHTTGLEIVSPHSDNLIARRFSGNSFLQMRLIRGEESSADGFQNRRATWHKILGGRGVQVGLPLGLLGNPGVD